jgi:hypothetical protein
MYQTRMRHYLWLVLETGPGATVIERRRTWLMCGMRWRREMGMATVDLRTASRRLLGLCPGGASMCMVMDRVEFRTGSRGSRLG